MILWYNLSMKTTIEQKLKNPMRCGGCKFLQTGSKTYNFLSMYYKFQFWTCERGFFENKSGVECPCCHRIIDKYDVERPQSCIDKNGW
jgi:hypothetical protein